MIFALDLPDGRATVRAASWYDAREWARAKGIPFPVLEVIPGASEESGAFAFDAPPANATPLEVAADYAKSIHALGVLEGLRRAALWLDAEAPISHSTSKKTWSAFHKYFRIDPDATIKFDRTLPR